MSSAPATSTTAKQGFGCMGITAFYGTPMEEADGVQLLLQVYKEGGVRHFDTAEVYRTGLFAPLPEGEEVKFNEVVVGKFLKEVAGDRENITVATKYYPGLHGGGCPKEAVLKAVDDSLERLGQQYVDIYYLHRLPEDHNVADFMEAMKVAVEQGKVRAVGLSEASPAKIREANEIFPVKYIQQEWSLLTRNLEEGVVPTCAELGITIVAYSPLARNLLTGVVTVQPTDFRASQPRYSEENLKKNMALVKEIEELGKSKNCSAAQLSLAWLFAAAKQRNVQVIPIPGTTKLKHALDNVASEKIELSEEEIAKLEAIGAQVAGTRGSEGYQRDGIEGQEAKINL